MIFNEIEVLWRTIEPYRAEVLSAVLTIAIAIAQYYLRPSVRLQWGRTNNSFHNLKDEKGKVGVYAEKYYLQNAGRKAATNVEFVFSFKPSEVSVWQARDYARKENPEGNFILLIPQIAPKELVIIDSLCINLPPAEVVSVKSADSLGRQVNFVVNRHFGRTFNWAAAIVLMAGIIYLVSLLLRLIL